MKALSLQAFEQQAEHFNRAVDEFPGIDPFCSRSDWILSFLDAFLPEVPLFIWRHNDSYLLLCESLSSDGHMFLTSPEPMWGFSAALVGPDSPSLLRAVFSPDGPLPQTDHTHLVLFGLPDNQHFLQEITAAGGLYHKPLPVAPTLRCVSALDGGVDGFLSRRTAKFRAGLRRALRKTASAGIAFKRIDALDENRLDEIYSEIVSVERKSWKGKTGEGADQPPMKQFYRTLLARITPAGQVRLIFAERNGEVIGYIYGAATGKHFRGLQFSFDERFSALGLGNTLQFQMITRLCEEGCLKYDLGMDVPYKRRWAETLHTTTSLFFRSLLEPCTLMQIKE